jgi:hypothetical protein
MGEGFQPHQRFGIEQGGIEFNAGGDGIPVIIDGFRPVAADVADRFHQERIRHRTSP